MASLANTVTSLYNLVFPQTEPRMATLRQKQAEMARALIRTHKTHSFHFLDLPSEIRNRIYTYVFAGNVVQVCSYNKDKSSATFSIDERCQILMTNKQIYEEARGFYYWHSDWKFVKVSSLNYIAWGDGGLRKLQYVQNVIITNQDVVTGFTDYLCFFPNLKILVLDFPTTMTLKTRMDAEEQVKIARKVKNGTWWKDRVGPHLPIASKRGFSIRVGILTTFDEDPENKEMLLVDVDRLKVTRNFGRIDPVPNYGFLHMPSSDDPDAELTMVHPTDIDDSLFQVAVKQRRSKRLLRDPSHID